VQVNQRDPNDYKFVLRIKNKLEIDDAGMQVMRDEKQKYKELIISYKTIY